MDPTYPLFPIFAFLGFLLPLITLRWHLLAWNSGTCYFIFWASLSCLNQFVNAVVWHGNALNPAPIWCDISVRIMMASSVGIPASSLCISKRLYHIATVQSVSITPSDKKRAIFFDTLICLVFPLVFLPIQYIVQGHRFDIYEDIGCFPAIYNVLPTYFLYLMWPVVLGLVSAVYCILTLRAFARRRADFSKFLSSNRSLTVTRYFRLMALSMTQLVFTVPLAVLMIVLGARSGVRPWISWEDTHFNFGLMRQLPAVLWRSDELNVVSMELTRWVNVLAAFIFFGFFGFADEAKRNYRVVLDKSYKLVGVKTPLLAPITSFRRPTPPKHKQFELPLYTTTTSSYAEADLKQPPTPSHSISTNATMYDRALPDIPDKADTSSMTSASTHESTSADSRRFTV